MTEPLTQKQLNAKIRATLLPVLNSMNSREEMPVDEVNRVLASLLAIGVVNQFNGDQNLARDWILEELSKTLGTIRHGSPDELVQSPPKRVSIWERLRG